MQATYVEEVSINPHSFYPGEGLTVLTPSDRSLDDRQKAVRGLQEGKLRASAFIDRVVSHREAAEGYRALRDEKDRVFSVIFDWRA
jgi:threonine dehydrogenase-like Zn-dependent dehydrogenase